MSFWISGSSIMQGPHQVAQKSITTTLPASSALVIVLVLPGPSSTVRVKLGAGLPTFSSAACVCSRWLEERVDLGEALGGLEGERPVLGDLGRDRAGGPAELLDRNVLTRRAPAANCSGSIFISMLESSLVAGSTVSRIPGCPWPRSIKIAELVGLGASTGFGFGGAARSC